MSRIRRRGYTAHPRKQCESQHCRPGIAVRALHTYGQKALDGLELSLLPVTADAPRSSVVSRVQFPETALCKTLRITKDSQRFREMGIPETTGACVISKLQGKDTHTLHFIMPRARPIRIAPGDSTTTNSAGKMKNTRERASSPGVLWPLRGPYSLSIRGESRSEL